MCGKCLRVFALSALDVLQIDLGKEEDKGNGDTSDQFDDELNRCQNFQNVWSVLTSTGM
jgi:hypothetical protein